MKKTLLIVGVIALLLPGAAMAQTASGQLTVTATVASSITLVFNSDAAGVALSAGAGTNAATLDFGSVSAYGAVPATITRTVGAGNFTVSTPVDVLVTRYNSASANYTLTAQLLNAPAAGFTWALGGVALNNTAGTSVTATGAYNSNVALPVAITIPQGQAAGVVSNRIDVTATMN